MISPLTEEDLSSMANRFEQWRKYLLQQNKASPNAYPSFSKLFNSLSAIHNSFFLHPTPGAPMEDTLSSSPLLTLPTSPQNTPIISNIAPNNNKTAAKPLPPKKKKRTRADFKKGEAKEEEEEEAAAEEERGNGKPAEREPSGMKEEEEESRLTAISDIPEEILLIVFEDVYAIALFPGRFVILALVCKWWHRMIRSVSSPPSKIYRFVYYII